MTKMTTLILTLLLASTLLMSGVAIRKEVYTYACGVEGYEYHQINGWTLESYKILIETIPEWVGYQMRCLLHGD